MPNKDSFTFSDKLKKSKSLPLSKRIPSKIGGDGKAKRTLIQRAQRDLPFIIVAAAALLLLPILSRDSGSEYDGYGSGTGYADFVPEDGSSLGAFDRGLGYDQDLSPTSGFRDPLSLIKRHSGDDSSAGSDFDRDSYNYNDDSISSGVIPTQKVSEPYRPAARQAIRKAVVREKTNVGALRSSKSLATSGGGGVVRNLAIGGARQTQGTGTTREKGRAVALTPMQALGKSGRSMTGEGLYAEAARSLAAMNRGSGKQALFDAQLQNVDGTPLGASGAGAAGMGQGALRGGGGGAPTDRFGYSPKTPWWWDFEKMKLMEKWKNWEGRLDKTLSDITFKIGTGLSYCLLTGSEDGSVKHLLGKKAGDDDYVCMLNGKQIASADALSKYASTSSGSGDNAETRNSGIDALMALCDKKGGEVVEKGANPKTWWQMRAECLGLKIAKKSDRAVADKNDCGGVYGTSKSFNLQSNKGSDATKLGVIIMVDSKTVADRNRDPNGTVKSRVGHVQAGGKWSGGDKITIGKGDQAEQHYITSIMGFTAKGIQSKNVKACDDAQALLTKVLAAEANVAPNRGTPVAEGATAASMLSARNEYTAASQAKKQALADKKKAQDAIAKEAAKNAPKAAKEPKAAKGAKPTAAQNLASAEAAILKADADIAAAKAKIAAFAGIKPDAITDAEVLTLQPLDASAQLRADAKAKITDPAKADKQVQRLRDQYEKAKAKCNESDNALTSADLTVNKDKISAIMNLIHQKTTVTEEYVLKELNADLAQTCNVPGDFRGTSANALTHKRLSGGAAEINCLAKDGAAPVIGSNNQVEGGKPNIFYAEIKGIAPGMEVHAIHADKGTNGKYLVKEVRYNALKDERGRYYAEFTPGYNGAGSEGGKGAIKPINSMGVVYWIVAKPGVEITVAPGAELTLSGDPNVLIPELVSPPNVSVSLCQFGWGCTYDDCEEKKVISGNYCTEDKQAYPAILVTLPDGNQSYGKANENAAPISDSEIADILTQQGKSCEPKDIEAWKISHMPCAKGKAVVVKDPGLFCKGEDGRTIFAAEQGANGLQKISDEAVATDEEIDEAVRAKNKLADDARVTTRDRESFKRSVPPCYVQKAQNLGVNIATGEQCKIRPITENYEVCSDQLSSSAHAKVRQQLYEDIEACLRQKTEGDINIRIEGHTSADGGVRNITLSDGRAITVANILVNEVLKGNNGLMPGVTIKYNFTPLLETKNAERQAKGQAIFSTANKNLSHCSGLADVPSNFASNVVAAANNAYNSNIQAAAAKIETNYAIVHSDKLKTLNDQLKKLRDDSIGSSPDSVSVNINGVEQTVSLSEGLALLEDNLAKAKAKGASATMLRIQIDNQLKSVKARAASYFDKLIPGQEAGGTLTYKSEIDRLEKEISTITNSAEYKAAERGLAEGNEGVRTVNVTIQGYSYDRPMKFLAPVTTGSTPNATGKANATPYANRRVLLCLADNAQCPDNYNR